MRQLVAGLGAVLVGLVGLNVHAYAQPAHPQRTRVTVLVHDPKQFPNNTTDTNIIFLQINAEPGTQVYYQVGLNKDQGHQVIVVPNSGIAPLDFGFPAGPDVDGVYFARYGDHSKDFQLTYSIP